MNKTITVRALPLPAKPFLSRPKLKTCFAAAALALALLAIPHSGRAHGIIGGAREGAREGRHDAGPVGEVVGGAIGAGVGGAVGAVDGVLGLPQHHWHRGCHGFYDHHNRFHCYR
jgi:hypothetical protein